MHFVLLLLTSLAAHAQYGSTFSFSIATSDPGCALVQSIEPSSNFPHLPNGDVTEVRFFYSNVNADHVTEDSPFQETTLTLDDQGQPQVTPNDFCGFAPGTYYFKYGLYDTNNNLLEFQDGFDPYQNQVQIVGPAHP